MQFIESRDGLVLIGRVIRVITKEDSEYEHVEHAGVLAANDAGTTPGQSGKIPRGVPADTKSPGQTRSPIRGACSGECPSILLESLGESS